MRFQSVQGQPIEDQRDSAQEFTIAYGSIYQLKIDLEEQGSFDVSRQSIHAEFMGPLGPRVTAGLELMYGIEKWDLTSLPTVAGATPWDTVYHHSFSLPIFNA